MSQKPLVEKQSWLSLAFLWAGVMICVPSLIVGGTLVSSLSVSQSIIVGSIGYLIISCLMILQGIQSTDLTKPAVSVANHVFGVTGSQKIISIILAVACLGWFGLQANVCGIAFSQFLALYGFHLPVPLSSFLWGSVMLTSAIYGIKLLRYLNYLAVPFLIVACLYGLYVAITTHDGSLITNYQPTTSLSFFNALAIPIGTFAVGAVVAGDFSQYCHKRSDVVKATFLGILPAGVLMLASGSILTVLAGTPDVTEVFMALGFPILGIIALVLATWTTNALNAFSGGLAIINIFNLPKNKEVYGILTAGILGTLLAVIGILNHFVPLMLLLSAMIPPVAGVMIASYWIVHKGQPEQWQSFEGVNWLGVSAWLIGAICASTPVALSFFPNLPQLPNQPLIGIVLSFLIYLLFTKGKVPVTIQKGREN